MTPELRGEDPVVLLAVRTCERDGAVLVEHSQEVGVAPLPVALLTLERVRRREEISDPLVVRHVRRLNVVGCASVADYP